MWTPYDQNGGKPNRRFEWSLTTNQAAPRPRRDWPLGGEEELPGQDGGSHSAGKPTTKMGKILTGAAMRGNRARGKTSTCEGTARATIPQSSLPLHPLDVQVGEAADQDRKEI